MNQQIQQVIYDAIEIVVDKKNSQLQFDRTIDCTVEEVVNLSTGEYKVQYLDKVFSAFDTNQSNYKIGKIVQVLIPQNDFSLKKTILGLKSAEEDLIDVVLNKDKVAKVGPTFEDIYKNYQTLITNCGIYGGYQGVKVNLFRNEINEDSLGVQTNYNALFREYAKDETMFMVSADFRTKWLKGNIISGNYGLEIIFELVNGDEASYYVQTNDFIGNPYSYINNNSMDFIFQIDGSQIKSLKEVNLFSQDFKRKDDLGELLNGIETDNYLKEIWNDGAGQSEIICENLSLSFIREVDKTGYFLSLSAPRGYYQDIAGGMLSLQANIEYNGDTINIPAFDFYWFKKNSLITSGSDNYNDLGGIGWELISNQNKNIYETIQLPLSVLSREYKVVAIHNGIKLTDTATLYQKFQTKPIGSIVEYRKGNGYSILEAVIDGITLDDTITYRWSVKNVNGAVTVLDSTAATLNIHTDSIVEYNVYECVVFKSGIEILVLTKRITKEAENKNYDIIFDISNGGVYTYDTAGDLYPPQAYEQPITEQSIDFQLSNNIDNYSYKWIFPENSLMTITNGRLNDNGDFISALTSAKTSIEFEIDKRYDVTKAVNNRIELVVLQGTEERHFYYDVLFIKEGDPGTNGTSLVMKVSAAAGSPVTLVPGGSVRLQVDLWYNGSATYGNQAVTSYFTIDQNSLLPRDYQALNCLVEGANISVSGNQITISAKDNFVSSLNPGTGVFNFNSLIQIKMTPKSNQEYFKYNVIGVYGIQISNNQEQANKSAEGTKVVIYDADGYSPSYSKVPMYLEGWQGSIAAGSTGGSLKRQYIDGEFVDTDIFEPIDYFTNKETYAAYDFTDDAGNHHFLPIAFMINSFSKEVINAWDGSSIQIDNEGGSILAPQIGAGIKDNNNLFTGVLMGGYIGSDDGSAVHGLYGFSEGQASFGFLENGTAFIGKTSGARILFNGNESTITSGNFSSGSAGMKIDLDKGSIEAYNFKLDSSALSINSAAKKFKFDMSTSNDNGTFIIKGSSQELLNITNGSYYLQSNNYSSGSAGMKIDLKNGSIDAENFKIDSNGKATFEGKITAESGKIAGWIIEDDYLKSSDGNTKLQANGKLYVDYINALDGSFKGKIEADSGTIGGWYIGEGYIASKSVSSDDGYIQLISGVNALLLLGGTILYPDSDVLRIEGKGFSVTTKNNIYLNAEGGYATLKGKTIVLTATAAKATSASLAEEITISNGTKVSNLYTIITDLSGGGSGGTATAVFG